MITTCKDCTERSPACWGSCPKYLKAKAEYEREKEEYKKKVHDENAITLVQYHSKRVFKAQKARKEHYG